MIPVLLILIPLLGGLSAFFIKNEKSSRIWTLLISLIVLVFGVYGVTLKAGAAGLTYNGEWMQALGGSFSVALDGMGQLLCLLTAIGFPLIFAATWNNTYKNANRFFALMLLSQAGLMGVFVAMDALLFYFFWELALIPVYFLCSQWGGEDRIRVTFKFFIYTFVGSVLMLIGILYLQSQTPDHSFSIYSFYKLELSPNTQSWLFWLFFAAFAIKMPVWPLHTWQPDTYEKSPGAVTMVLSGIMVKMGVLGLIRWLLPVFPVAAYSWGDVVGTLCIIGIIYASLIAIRQDDIRRLIAYSSIAHIGLMCLAVFSANESGMQGVMIQMFNHGINIIGLWILADIIEKKYGTRKMSGLGGLAQQAPVMSIFFVIIALANIALPLTNGFVGEFLMFNGVINTASNYYFIFIIGAGMGIILGAVYTLNMVRKTFYGANIVPSSGIPDLSWNEKLALSVIVIIILILGVYPQLFLNISEDISKMIVNKVDVRGLISK